MTKPPKSPDIETDWADEISDVSPIKGRKKKAFELPVDDWSDLSNLKPRQRAQKSNPATITAAPEENFRTTTGNVSIDQLETNLLSGYDPSLDLKTRKRLAKGEYSFSARLDLHGYTMDEAWDSCMKFINQAFEQRLRCVLLVHGKGKGYGDKGNMGLIKAQISGWLSNSPHVMAYHTALPKHGGSGAVYVLLRKNKEQEEV